MVVTVDGPGGAGKTTISRALAAALNYAFLDTGAMYRAIAVSALRAGKDLPAMDAAARRAWLRGIELRLTPQGLFMDNRPVEPFIRAQEAAAAASVVSALQEVREFLLYPQRQAARCVSLVAEGRDMGTVVFPEAEVKFFLTADLRERARRRWRDLSPVKPQLSLDEVRREIAGRDERDSQRALAPLKPAADAVIIDSTNMGQDEVTALMLRHIKRAGG
jgi:cytidylate kinase